MGVERVCGDGTCGDGVRVSALGVQEARLAGQQARPHPSAGVGGTELYEIGLRGEDKTHHVHNVIMHQISA